MPLFYFTNAWVPPVMPCDEVLLQKANDVLMKGHATSWWRSRLLTDYPSGSCCVWPWCWPWLKFLHFPWEYPATPGVGSSPLMARVGVESPSPTRIEHSIPSLGQQQHQQHKVAPIQHTTTHGDDPPYLTMVAAAYTYPVYDSGGTSSMGMPDVVCGTREWPNTIQMFRW